MDPSEADVQARRQRSRTMIGAGLVLLVATLALTSTLAADRGDALTRNTVRLSLAWYAATLCLMMTLRPADWTATSARGQLARWCWTWGWACFIVHVGLAFHYFHRWSHAHALHHTRQVSGVGEGLYVSYLFTLLWTADVLWWWAKPSHYAVRSATAFRALHAFMGIIVFNGTVVFESGWIRWAGVVLFAGLAAMWLIVRSRRAASMT